MHYRQATRHIHADADRRQFTQQYRNADTHRNELQLLPQVFASDGAAHAIDHGQYQFEQRQQSHPQQAGKVRGRKSSVSAARHHSGASPSRPPRTEMRLVRTAGEIVT